MAYVTSCTECGKDYTAKRSTSKYCSAKCRNRAHRRYSSDVNHQIEISKIRESLQHLNKLSDKALVDEWQEMSNMLSELDRFQKRYRSIGLLID